MSTDPSDAAVTANQQCEHKFVHLRSSKKNIGFDRNPVWQHFDVYFCEKCLEYKEVNTHVDHPGYRL